MSFLKGGKFNKPIVTETTAETTTTTKPAGPSPFGKKKLGGLNKPKTEPNELDLDKQEDLKAETPVAPAEKPKLGGKKKLGGLKLANNSDLDAKSKKEAVEEAAEKLAEIQTEQDIPVELTEEQEAEIAAKEDLISEAEFCGDTSGNNEVITTTVEDQDNKSTVEVTTKEIKATVEEKEPAKEEKKTKRKSKKKTTATIDSEGAIVVNGTITVNSVDESKRISIEEMDAVMRPIVAPTTELWEQEKKDILAALDNIKVEQDMTMSQVKSALAELDDLKFEVLPKQHDAETLYDGTKQNYDTVKAIAIAKGSGTNAEARKAEGILACQNYVTPSGQVVDLHQYMLLIEERNKFYQKINEGINFKKYSLVNYNNALKIESKEL